jgi:hypothetical protein
MVGLMFVTWAVSAVISLAALISKSRVPDFITYLFIILCPVVNTIYAIYVIKVRMKTFDIKDVINQIKLD